MSLRRLVPIFALFFLCAGCGREEPADNAAAVEVGGPAKGVDRSKAGQPLPDAVLRDADGEQASLAGASGEPLLVNLWATWCAPCVKELPTLKALSDRAGAPRVIAVSQDMGDRKAVDEFLQKNELAGLEVWHDPDMTLSSALNAQVLPTTILYDANGREVWRYVGDLDWTGPEAGQLLAPVSPEAAR